MWLNFISFVVVITYYICGHLLICGRYIIFVSDTACSNSNSNSNILRTYDYEVGLYASILARWEFVPESKK